MTIFYSVLPKNTIVKIMRSLKNSDSIYEYEMTVDEAIEGGYWSTDSGTMGVTSTIVGSKDTLNKYNKNAEISVVLINGIPCARTGFDFSDGKGDKPVIEKGLWCQEDMPELKEPWELL
ncbi:hypothetical protein [Salmonella enterica]|uniref:Uncharacterized protein n=2 Tax=Salmonella enterica I TaxID=59201 RepID=A0A659MH44_SALET|nr:hypothetical protein [Salmonella enterica]TGC36861.1 hypothetical protein C9F01_04570 [Salmonella enterica subsp. enterica serovar Wernigerode]TGC38543.1 hypothetical protein C9E93_15885 [Salmonella enterica subsp. enterica serovar Wernigerode]TGC97698.1 hypothetical protein C9F05_14375 [Salmonella enterica subsp. enterica serovar Wernigerode]